jgi:branched-chain amino acid transport system substrate-binding protein
MNHRSSRTLALLTCLALLASLGCRQEPADPIVLGAIYNLTGAQSGLDRPSSLGAQLAVDEANDAGGVLGRPVKLVIEDGESAPETVKARTAEILEQHPQTTALLGLSDTDMVLAAAPVAAEAGRVFVTSGATSPQLPAEVPEFLFLACFGDNVQAAAGAEWAFEELGARSVVVLYDQGMIYTRLLHGYFEQRFEQLGGEVVLSRPFDSFDLDSATMILPTADLYYIASGPQDTVGLAQRLREQGLEAPILGGDSFDEPAAWRGDQELSGVFFTTHAAVDSTDPGLPPATRSFIDAYQTANGGEPPDAFAALGYDTVRLLLQAIREAGADDPEAVRQALAATSGFEGITGTLSYPEGQRVPKKSVTILEVSEGVQHFVEQRLPEVVPPPGPVESDADPSNSPTN